GFVGPVALTVGMDSITRTGWDTAVPALSTMLSTLLGAPAPTPSGAGDASPADSGGADSSQTPGFGLLTDEALLELLTATDRLVSIAEAARAAVIREAEAREAAAHHAACSTTTWLLRTHAHTRAKARKIVTDAGKVGTFPALVEAANAGTVSSAQAAAIAHTLAELPDDLPPAPDGTTALEQAAATMIGFAAEHDPHALLTLGWRLLETIAPERAEEILADQLERDEQRAINKRGVRLYPDHHGSWTLRGSLPNSEGEELSAILSAYADNAWRTAIDNPHPGVPTGKDHLRADALMDIVRTHQTHRAGPTHGGDRPRVTVFLSWDTLVGGLGQMALSGGSFLTAAEIRRLACDCDLIPAVLNTDGIPLDLGRSHRLVTPDLRTAVVARDQGCAFPGCTKPPAACEVHHIIPWWAGGPTSLDNLVLLCPHHHRTIEPTRAWPADEPHRWSIQLGPDHIPQIIPPTGGAPTRTPPRPTRHTTMRH
ncbi:MAG: DUF222 domain-containing protein, partial [Propionibacteriaceae bacterium]|nr:DUF222 domain-containing protein [Propionibacteriaceae bacterium]